MSNPKNVSNDDEITDEQINQRLSPLRTIIEKVEGFEQRQATFHENIEQVLVEKLNQTLAEWFQNRESQLDHWMDNFLKEVGSRQAEFISELCTEFERISARQVKAIGSQNKQQGERIGAQLDALQTAVSQLPARFSGARFSRRMSSGRRCVV
jgi:hypothetical protein